MSASSQWSPQTMVAELHRLPKGRGVAADPIEGRLGPGLRRLAGIGPADGSAQVRTKLVRLLLALTARLPDDLRVTALAALGLQPETEQMRFLDQRVVWLCGHLSCADRTARRRIDESLRRLAEEAARELTRPPSPKDADEGWYVESLRTVLHTDTVGGAATEERRIVSTVDGLAEITHRASIPRDPSDGGVRHGVGLRLRYGGELRLDGSQGSHFRYVLALPSVLDRNERHEYGVEMNIPPGQVMVPHYLCVPLRRHDSFELRIRFDTGRPPRQVWRVDAAPPRTVDARVPTEEVLPLDRFGEVHTAFRDLRIGFGYGIQWQP